MLRTELLRGCEHDDAYIRGLLEDLGPAGDGDGICIAGARVTGGAAALAEEPTGLPLACLLSQVDLTQLEAFSLVDAVADASHASRAPTLSRAS
ncbi:hypothetical protein [Georgenia wangjunii]|uniref:hypothetical protein n=1 Tax=Georgenia wangjunii TaxID=3117730 RepID=UPI002F26C1BB